MAKQLFIIFSVLTTWSFSTGQHSPYSLQSAVDALHRREQQLALKENYDPSIKYPLSLEETSYWNGQNELNDLPPYRGNRQQINKLLASYLAREEEERDNGIYPNDYDDEYGPDERKRSFFREREELPYQSVFRERELEVQPDLTEDFLREMEQERNLEREEKYRDTLRRMWDKYQQQENEIEDELFDEDEDKKKKRSEFSPMYYGPPMASKKSYPVLPWLPASRKKRFPVAKRSPKEFEVNINVSGTNDKVSKDLDEIFGETIDDKKKRSSDDGLKKKRSDDSDMDEEKKRAVKKSEHVPDDDNDDDEHDDNDDEHEHERHEEEDDEDDDHDFDDSEEDDDKKKKRAIHKKKRSNLEVVKEDQIIPGDLSDFKKKKSSIQWSKYFGMDRRKKSVTWLENDKKKKKKKSSDDYPLHNFRNHDLFEDDRKKKNYNEDKIENMDDKLKNIEELIIDETIKYTGAHEGVSNPDEIRKLKDHVVSRLATAYSLEKMRRALEKLKQSSDDDHHLNHNEIPEDLEEKKKRVAVKKEKAEFDNNHHKIESASEKVTPEEPANGLEESDDDKKKKKKKSELPVFSNDLNDFEEELGAGHFIEPMSESYMGGKDMDGPNDCPLLDSIEKRCRNVDLLSGDIHQELLPICAVHQLCYLCGTTQTACDFQYLSEADSVCGHNSECQSAARSALMILRGAPNPQLGPKECSKNECLYRAMREIGL